MQIFVEQEKCRACKKWGYFYLVLDQDGDDLVPCWHIEGHIHDPGERAEGARLTPKDALAELWACFWVSFRDIKFPDMIVNRRNDTCQSWMGDIASAIETLECLLIDVPNR